MPVRNKKESIANRQKIEKVQHLKLFVNEMAELIVKAASLDVLQLIPPYEIEYLYNVRIHPVRLKAAPGENIPSDLLQFANHMVTLLFKNFRVPVKVGQLEQLSLYDFFSTAYTLMVYVNGLKDDAYTRATEVKKVLMPFADAMHAALHEAAFSKYNQTMNAISLFCSDINDSVYAIKFNPEIMARGVSKAGLFSEIYRKPLPKVKVMSEGQFRPALQLGWYLPEPELRLKFVNLRSEDIFLPPGKTLHVYIQSHALSRLAERLDGIEPGILHFNIFNSFNEPKLCRNRKGVRLFEYSIFDNKVGYFVFEIVDEKVLLKTFLFLTHSGTPEADRLQATLGLMKEDIMYLAIDKLSAFVHSDIGGNERVKQLFIDAGCESLFNVDIGYAPDGNVIASKAERIAKYLQLETFNEGIK